MNERKQIEQKADLYIKDFHNTELSKTDLILFAEQIVSESVKGLQKEIDERENECHRCVEKKKDKQLAKAKEIIKEYMRFEPMIGTCSFYSEEYEKTKKKAEAFLKE